MGLRKVRLGELIELVDERNIDGRYGFDDVRGVNNLKKMILTKADISARDLTKFQVIEPGVFFFNHRTSRNGSKFSITYNYDNKTHITTEDYVLFRVKEDSGLDPIWLYLYVCRDEFDRYCIMNSWGSSTEFYNWEDLCDVELELPPIEVQRKYVAVYEAMLANQRSYERGLEDLKLTADAALDNVKNECARYCNLGALFTEVDNRNTDLNYKIAYGLNIQKQFMVSKASSDDLTKYKIVMPGQFAYSAMQTGRDNCIRVTLLDKETPVIVSPAYSVLEVTSSAVLAEYLMIWFMRPESDRRGAFMSDGSIRANLDLSRFYETEIPIPSIETQRAIADIYKVYRQRTEINERLKTQLKDLCPILIKGSIDEARAS